MSSDELVSVIVPAYNAEATLPATLASIRAQTYEHLEILVVDDGSRDGTARLVVEAGKADPRIRLITQENAGVAAARNRGIDQAKGLYIAPVDADDLWQSRKIERQLRTLRSAGPDTALVYGWNALIDARGRIIRFDAHPMHVGDVLGQLCYGNFIGNGSCALMRRDAAIGAGGFDPSLRARNAQGCEDWKLFLRIAERSHFALVPDHLTGYRIAAEAMSGDVAQMLRSDALVRAETLERLPEHRLQLRWGRRNYIQWLLRRELEGAHWDNCRLLFRASLESETNRLRAAARTARFTARLAKHRLRRKDGPRPDFGVDFLPRPTPATPEDGTP